MFVLMGKLFLPLIQPLGISACCWVLAVLLHWRGRTRGACLWMVAGILVVLVSASPLVGARLLHGLEDDFVVMTPAETPEADVIVILGGMTAPAIPPRVEVDVAGAFDRLLHGVRLWRAGKAPVIIVSGGVMAELVGSQATEAERLRRLAMEYGVDEGALLLETRSRTTRENAVYTRELLRRRHWRRVLLVTSAAHMRRALGAFRALDVEVIAAPTDVRIVPLPFHPGRLLPSALGLEYTTQALKEHLGWWVYRLRGWVR